MPQFAARCATALACLVGLAAGLSPSPTPSGPPTLANPGVPPGLVGAWTKISRVVQDDGSFSDPTITTLVSGTDGWATYTSMTVGTDGTGSAVWASELFFNSWECIPRENISGYTWRAFATLNYVSDGEYGSDTLCFAGLDSAGDSIYYAVASATTVEGCPTSGFDSWTAFRVGGLTSSLPVGGFCSPLSPSPSPAAE